MDHVSVEDSRRGLHAGHRGADAARTRRLSLGVSPRGSQALYRAAQALALLEGREYAIPDDVKRLAVPVFAHRVVVNSRTALAQRRSEWASALSKRFSRRSTCRCSPSPNMKTAIIGLPMVGKTSLFTILTGVHQETRIGSTAARTGVAKVPDARLDALARPIRPAEVTHAIGRVRRCAGHLERDAARSRATSPVFGWWMHSRTCCAFSQTRPMPHEKGSVDPVRDLEDLETELILSDLVVIEKRLERLEKDRKKIKNPELDREFELLERARRLLEDNKPAARSWNLTPRRRSASAASSSCRRSRCCTC